MVQLAAEDGPATGAAAVGSNAEVLYPLRNLPPSSSGLVMGGLQGGADNLDQVVGELVSNLSGYRNAVKPAASFHSE